jgi:hypothetical protein
MNYKSETVCTVAHKTVSRIASLAVAQINERCPNKRTHVCQLLAQAPLKALNKHQVIAYLK